MSIMTRTLPGRQKQNVKIKHGRRKNTKLRRVKKEKASDRSQKGSRKERALRDLFLLDLLNPRLPEQKELSLNPNQKLDHVWQTVSYRNDVNQAQTYMETCDMEFSRLHGLHRPGTAEEARCFKPGKWSFSAQHRIALYSHDAKRMKNFTLHFDCENQRESLDRLWFGEVWFPVSSGEVHVQSPGSSLSRSCPGSN